MSYCEFNGRQHKKIVMQDCNSHLLPSTGTLSHLNSDAWFQQHHTCPSTVCMGERSWIEGRAQRHAVLSQWKCREIDSAREKPYLEAIPRGSTVAKTHANKTPGANLIRLLRCWASPPALTPTFDSGREGAWVLRSDAWYTRAQAFNSASLSNISARVGSWQCRVT